MPELLLLRHGKSDWSRDVDDFSRPLKDRGKRGAQRIGSWLARQGLQPDRIVSSPAERALATAEKCCKAMGRDARQIQTDASLYLADCDTILTCIRNIPAEVGRLLLVGHNPGLEDALLALAVAPPEIPGDGKYLPTATLARMLCSRPWTDWSRGCAELAQWQRGKDLPNGFPYPLAQPVETRPRPAYYYTQACAIPWRRRRGEIEVLVLGSSSGRHATLPKGIVDPGLSPAEAAAKEAEEEAGVRGLIDPEPLGHYRYAKWGAEPDVTVFALEVKHILPEDRWDEPHRGRQWLPVAQAREALSKDAIKPQLDALRQRLG